MFLTFAFLKYDSDISLTQEFNVFTTASRELRVNVPAAYQCNSGRTGVTQGILV